MDELLRESVTFNYISAGSTVDPPNLFRADPIFNANGSISLFPTPDLFGTSTLIVEATDSHVSDPLFVPQTVRLTITVNVQPVNDAPTLNAIVLDESASNPATPGDDAYNISDTGALTFTLKEDNTAAGGATSPYEILATNPNFLPSLTGGNYERPGLLDLYVAGPDNELAALPGGSQVLNLASFSGTTTLGGTVEAVRDGNNNIVSLQYTPPTDYNIAIGGVDSFAYTVVDDSTTGGESYSLFNDALIDDRRTANGRVLINLQPVNDQPEFETSNLDLEISEDQGVQNFGGFAFNISAGPSDTADDENDLLAGQEIEFDVNPLSYSRSNELDFFSSPPRITDAGTLIYQTAADVFGTFEFEVTLMDLGASDVARGDLNVSDPVTLTINVLPVNDPPRLGPGVNPLAVTIAEDMPILLPADGGATQGDLLGSYIPGATNEIPAGVGGGQTISITSFPVTTSQGGSLDPVLDAGNNITGYTYTPPENFVGTDFLIYTITDDGQTVPPASGGTPIDDPRSTDVTVPITVEARNDAPVFSLGNDVTVTEGDGAITIVNWMVGVAAGPPTASDEIAGANPQTLTINLVPVNGNVDFVSAPVVQLQGDAATLQFEAEENAFGEAVFDAVLRDNGTNDPANGHFATTTHRFTIAVTGVNDPPTFTAGPAVSVDEDSGEYDQQWATNISPGPNEFSQTIDRFEVVVPTEFQGLFSEQPTISPSGVLSFTPAPNAAGQVNLQVTAVDSEGGRSQTVILPIMIVDLNDPPVAVDDQITTDENTVLTLEPADLLANDIDPDLDTNPAEVLTISLAQTSFFTGQGAQVTFDPVTGQITYDPTTSTILDQLAQGDQPIVDRFTYTVSDGEAQDSAEVILTVEALNDAPRLGDDSFDVLPSTATTLTILDNDSDIDGSIDPSSIIVTTQPSNGALEVEDDGTVIYTPLDGFRGSDSFRYTVADNNGQQSEQASVSLRIGAPPATQPINAGTSMGLPVDIDVLDGVDGAEPSTVTIVSGPSNGSAVVLPTGEIRYTPSGTHLGPDTIVFTVEDSAGFVSQQTTISINVVESTLQNPTMFADVNASGEITPIDALLVINKLARDGSEGAIPVQDSDRGPNFYDANGDMEISPRDALKVINDIARGSNAPVFEGEQVTPLSQVIAAPTAADPISSGDQLSTIEAATDKIVSAASLSQEMDLELLDLIVSDDNDDDDDISAIDEAITLLD